MSDPTTDIDDSVIDDLRRRVILADQITSRLKVPVLDGRSPVVCIVSPCRCGSTALLRATGCAGYRSYFQPLKRLIRKLLLGQNAGWELPYTTDPIVIKEAFGPFLLAEAGFD